MDPQIIESTPVSLAEVKHELSKIKKRDNELTFRGNKTEDHINSIHVVSTKTAKEIYSKIESLGILRIKPKHIIKFIDLMPESENEVKYIASSMSLVISKDNISKIFKIIEEHRK